MLAENIACEKPPPTSPTSLAAVFLDVDGVIDSRKVPCLEATKVERLRRAVAAVPDCVVVISSHWRLVPKQLTTLSAVLQYHGLHVIGVTPSQQPWEPKRPLEIAQWLETYNTSCRELGMPQVTAFVTVDDRDLVNEQGGAALCGRAVHTSRLAGLQESDADEIVALLTAQRAGRGGGLPPVPGLAACPSVPWVDETPQSVVTLMNDVLTPRVSLPFVVQLVRYPPAARSGKDGATPCGESGRSLVVPRHPTPAAWDARLRVWAAPHTLEGGAAAAQGQAAACSAASCLCPRRSLLSLSTHPGPEYALRVVAGATAPGGLRGAPPTSPPKALWDDNACSKRVAPAERWSLLWRHRHTLWRPSRRLSREQSSGSGVGKKGAQTTEVVGSERSDECVVVKGSVESSC